VPKYKIVDEGGNFYTVKDVPIFELHSDRGFPCDDKWMNAAIENHVKYKGMGYRPPVIIGHNTPGLEKESVGFLDSLVLRGRRLYADIVRIPKDIKEKLLRNAFPSRSVEVLPTSKRILALALLGGTTPHFALPQMAYEDGTGETHLYFRSPEMAEITDEMKREIYAHVGEAVATALPQALAALNDNGDEGTVEFTHPETGETYSVPAALAKLLTKGKAVASTVTHAGKAAAAGGKVSAKLGLGKGVGRVVGKGVGKAGGFVKRHPVGTAAAAGAGIAAGRASKRKYSQEGYAIDDSTGEVYLNGELLGLVVTYEDLQEAGMDVPTAVKHPEELPEVEGDNEGADWDISEEDVGEGSGVEEDQQTSPGEIQGTDVQPLAREDSDQFALAQKYELLRREVVQLKTANNLLAEGRRSESYQQWLEEQKSQGVPVGDIEKTVEFMMSLSAEQAEQHKQLLLSQPKVAFGRMEKTVTFAQPNNEAEIKQDYAAHKDVYQSMGVTDKDLKWARFVRSNRAVGEIQGT